MTYEEAINQLNSVVIYHEAKCTREALDIAIKCIEKQIPKEPYREYDDEGYIEIEECPTCHTLDIFVFDEEQNYCSNCGQSIKWE